MAVRSAATVGGSRGPDPLNLKNVSVFTPLAFWGVWHTILPPSTVFTYTPDGESAPPARMNVSMVAVGGILKGAEVAVPLLSSPVHGGGGPRRCE